MAAAGPVAARAENDVKRVGLIGCGWYGKSDLCRLIQVAPVEVVSLCDVDRNALSEAADLFALRQKSKKKPRAYHDYREMLKEKDLDVVLVGTPDHWHALAMIAAVEAGADVYVQKPISVDVAEGQAMVAAARKHKRVVQVGLERRTTPHLIEAKKEIIDSGKLGTIGLVEIYCYFSGRAGNPPDSKPPEGFDYDLWTGPAPMRPYNNLVHSRGWRNFMEYGNGILGDMGVHMLDLARWMLNLGWPISIDSSGGILVDIGGKANTPDTQTAVFDFGKLQVVWQHRCWGSPPDPNYYWGANFYGDQGTLKAGVFSYDFIPRAMHDPRIHRDCVIETDKYPEDKTEKGLEDFAAPGNRGNMRNFMDCVASREKPVSDIEEGHISTASCILGNVSMKLGRRLRWDSQAGQILGDPEASALLRRPYRTPWAHPEAGAV